MPRSTYLHFLLLFLLLDFMYFPILIRFLINIKLIYCYYKKRYVWQVSKQVTIDVSRVILFSVKFILINFFISIKILLNGIKRFFVRYCKEFLIKCFLKICIQTYCWDVLIVVSEKFLSVLLMKNHWNRSKNLWHFSYKNTLIRIFWDKTLWNQLKPLSGHNEIFKYF